MFQNLKFAMTEHATQARKTRVKNRKRVLQNNARGFNKLKQKITELEQELDQIENENCRLHAQNIKHNTIGWLCKTLLQNIQQQILLAKIQFSWIYWFYSKQYSVLSYFVVLLW